MANGSCRDGPGRDWGAPGGSAAATGMNGVAKVTEKKISLGQYKDRKAAGKVPAKTTPLPASVTAGSGLKNYPVTTGDKRSVLFFFCFFCCLVDMSA